ncbi:MULTISPECIES: NUDIX domain-containing protein [unclassified Haloarcula]|uniref:NUDIX domain-containing protein n=1 Tax=unclassified Haloarcula TaxID=2624677 RepID=UPI00300ECAC8
MEIAERSRARVQERLARLEQEFGSTPVDQTTFSVGAEGYQRAVERSREGQVDVHAFVHNESGDVLLSDADGSWEIPQGQTQGAERPAAAAERVVTETAGVSCTIRDAVRATICGVRNETDQNAETVYRLSIVFDAEVNSAALEGDDTETVDGADASIRWDDSSDVAVAELV